MAEDKKNPSMLAQRKDILGFLCPAIMMAGTASFWQENPHSEWYTWPIFLVWTLIPIGILLLLGKLMDTWFPFPVIHNGANAFILLVGLLGLTGYLHALIFGPSDPDTAGHLGIFLVSPLQILLTVFLFALTTVWGVVLRITRKTPSSPPIGDHLVK